MDDLVQFLRARLDEDVAKAASWHDLECDIHSHLNDGLLASIAASQMLDEVPGAVCDCGGPARVLREVEAKQRLLGEHQHDGSGACALCALPEDFDDDAEGNRTFSRSAQPWPCTTVKILALPYADHPDHRDAWRP
ncbi:DUF6221 family protein [Streptomyces anulatus]|uniref:DUF6221 family protein n=1 Tax=Streptomyces anulatus TaxID=1892 RepID=UPI0022539D68|nr:DUF6221 family protein [Streptomyces anulatus]MCX4601201.1 DUF6221 family protein [Streptomyces anulatus]